VVNNDVTDDSFLPNDNWNICETTVRGETRGVGSVLACGHAT